MSHHLAVNPATLTWAMERADLTSNVAPKKGDLSSIAPMDRIECKVRSPGNSGKEQ